MLTFYLRRAFCSHKELRAISITKTVTNLCQNDEYTAEAEEIYRP